MSNTFLETPSANSVAGQCRQMGVSVGDLIEGVDRCGNLERLQLLWLGETLAVFSVSRRAAGRDIWDASFESANWVLHVRPWYKVLLRD